MTDDEAKALKAQNEKFRSDLQAAETTIQELKTAATAAANAHAAELAAVKKQHAKELSALNADIATLQSNVSTLEARIVAYREGAIAKSLEAVQATLSLIQADK